MKVAHFSDTHLGFAAYGKVDPKTDINQREQDFYDAFARTIDAILGQTPNLIVHAGDLFDTVRPSNRAINVCLEGFKKFSKAGIPTVVIAGNHETPRIRTTGSILKALRHLDGVFPACSSEYERFEVAGVAVHAVSDAPSDEELQRALGTVQPVRGQPNILVAHGGHSGSDRIESGEYNEHLFPLGELKRLADFDYIALGHYHKHHAVKGLLNAWYSGATERTSFSQAQYIPGFVMVELADGKPRHHPVQVRPMVQLESIDAKGLGPEEILNRLAQAVDGRLTGALARAIILNVASAARAGIDPGRLAEITHDAAHFEIDWRLRDGECSHARDDLRFLTLEAEFEGFMKDASLGGGLDRGILVKLGTNYLRAARDQEERRRED